MAHKISFIYSETKDPDSYDEVKRVEIHTETSHGVTLVEYFAEFCRSIGLDPLSLLDIKKDDEEEEDKGKPH